MKESDDVGTFQAPTLYDRASGRPVAGVAVTVTSWPEGDPVTTDPAVIGTDRYGRPRTFTVDGVDFVQVAAGSAEPQVVESLEHRASGGGGGGAVDSVNGQTGTVVLDASDVGAVAPGDLADVATTGAYSDLTGTPTIPATPGDVGAATAAQGSLADTAVQPGDDAGTLGSGAATSGQVLTADGAGAASWATPAGGGGGGAFPYPPITSGSTAWWAGPAQSGTGRHKGLGYASLYPLLVGHAVRVTAFQINLTDAGDGSVHAALYGTTDGVDPRGAAKVADLLVAADATSTGAKTASGLTVDLAPGLYWVAILTTGTVQPKFAGTAGDMSLFVPKRNLTREGGLEGASGLSTLPSTYPAADAWNISGAMVWFGLQTEVIP